MNDLARQQDDLRRRLRDANATVVRLAEELLVTRQALAAAVADLEAVRRDPVAA